MDFYTLCKFLHVVAVALWVGSGFSMLVLGTIAERAGERDELVHVTRQFLRLTRFQGPASGLVLIFGGLAAWLSWSFLDLWIDIGLVAFVILFATGGLFFAPRIKRAIAAFDRGDTGNAALADARAVLMAARFDYTMLVIVMADMVFKPTLSEWPLLLIMALALIAVAIVFLGPLVRPQQAA